MQTIIAEYGDVIKSVAADNGVGFTIFSRKLKPVAQGYIMHSYTSSECGTNEFHNRMLRRDFPKGELLATINLADAVKTTDRLNDMFHRVTRRVFRRRLRISSALTSENLLVLVFGSSD